MTLDKISDKLFEAKKIAIFTHISPDCDGFGSMFALYEGLKQLGKKCSMFVDGKLNKFEEQIFEMSKVNKTEVDARKFDTFIAVDTATLDRLGKYKDIFASFENSYKIDHHVNKEHYGKYVYVDHEKSSCSEVIYELLTKLNVRFDKKTTTYLYAGIATDTNSFLNTNTTANSYRVAYKLFENGADTVKVNKQCFRTISKESINLMKLYYNKIKFIGENFAYIILNNKDFKKTKTSHLDTSNFSNMLCEYEGVKIACCVTEREDCFSCSFRSTIDYNVHDLASLLGGGGHAQAAGARIYEKEKVVEKKLIDAVKKYLGSR